MKIQLVNFGTFEKKLFEFPSGFILFQGENGSGKSTIFKAIAFVLYDKYKTVKHGKEECQVILTESSWKVHRISKPKTLNLEYNGVKYHGTTAQEIIIDKIMNMNYDQFCLSTMINSNTRCSLASITSGDRFNVIRDLVSCLDQPKLDVEKLIAYEKSLNSGSDISSGGKTALTLQLTRLQNQLGEYDSNPVTFDQEEYNDIKTNLSDLREKRDKWLEMLSKGVTKDEAIEKLDQLNMRNEIALKISNLKKNLEYVRHLDIIKSAKLRFENDKTAYFQELQDELDNLVSQSETLSEDKLKKWAIETEIRKTARDQGNPFYDKSVNEISENGVNMTKLTCPHCQEQIGVNGESVVKWKPSWNESDHDLSKLAELEFDWDEDAGKKWERAVKIRMRISELKRLIEKQVLSSELVRLKKSFGEKQTPPTTFKSNYTVDYLQGRIEFLTDLLGSYPKESDRQLLESIVAIKKYPTREGLNRLTTEIKDFESKFEHLQRLRDKFTRYQTVCHLQDQIRSIQTEIDHIDKKTSEIKNEMVAIDRLKQLQREAETMSMETVVNTINTYASEYLSKFFDDMIQVQLILYKKTLKNTKMSIELEIEYNGQKYDIGEFSQGEAIKINLSFILAMNRLQNSKYLFLDEVLQNLDKDILLEIYSCLHSLCDNMTVFVIQHNSIDGFFDHTVEFKK